MTTTFSTPAQSTSKRASAARFPAADRRGSELWSAFSAFHKSLVSAEARYFGEVWSHDLLDRYEPPLTRYHE